jgi:hypothetical protein
MFLMIFPVWRWFFIALIYAGKLLESENGIGEENRTSFSSLYGYLVINMIFFFINY